MEEYLLLPGYNVLRGLPPNRLQSKEEYNNKQIAHIEDAFLRIL